MSDFLKKQLPMTTFLICSPTLMMYQSDDGLGGILFLLIFLAVIVFALAGVWKVYVKAGEPGWAAIVPIYNLIVLLKIAGRPVWWVILYLIPFVNFVIAIMVSIDVAKKFGQGVGFGLGLVFLSFIFYPILGFGSAQYMTSKPVGRP